MINKNLSTDITISELLANYPDKIIIIMPDGTYCAYSSLQHVLNCMKTAQPNLNYTKESLH